MRALRHHIAASQIEQACVTLASSCTGIHRMILIVDKGGITAHVSEEILTFSVIASSQSWSWWERQRILSFRRGRRTGAHVSTKDVARALSCLSLPSNEGSVQLALVLQEACIWVDKSNFRLHFVGLLPIGSTNADKGH